MGLDTTHDCWHGSYSAFNSFREEIAKVLNVPLGLMEGFYDASQKETLFAGMPQWMKESFNRNTFDYLPISWDILKPDAIYTLLNHSDCDGEIEIKDLLPIAERLEAIAPLLPDASSFRFDVRAKALQFATGLRLAADLGEIVEFR